VLGDSVITDEEIQTVLEFLVEVAALGEFTEEADFDCFVGDGFGKEAKVIVDFQGNVSEFIPPDTAEDFIEVFFELIEIR